MLQGYTDKVPSLWLKFNQFKVLMLCGGALSLYLLVIFNVGTIPSSDFKSYYDTALEISRGGHALSQYKYFQPAGYPYLLSLMFYLLDNNSVLLPQIMNALMLSSLLWIHVKYPMSNYIPGFIIGYIVMVFNINYLSMVSVLCSEIPYAFFLLLGFFFLWGGIKRALSDEDTGFKSQFLYFSVSGLFLGISQWIRPLTFVYLIFVCLFMVVGLRYFIFEETKSGWIGLVFTVSRVMCVTWLLFLTVSIMLYWFSGYGVTCMPHQKGLWNLFVGFNIESKGAYNTKDAKMLYGLGDRYNWNAEKINEEFRPIVFDRIHRNWLKSIRILPNKIYLLLNPVNIPYWAVAYSRIENVDIIDRISRYLRYLNLLALVVSAGAWFVLISKTTLSIKEFFYFCMLGATFVYLIFHSYCFEVQGRYSNHLWMVMFWSYPLSQQIVSRIFKGRLARGR